MKLTDRTLAGRPADLAAENRELHQLRAQRDQLIDWAERQYVQFINAVLVAPKDGSADAWRWRGHAEAYRQMAEAIRLDNSLPKVRMASAEWRAAHGVYTADQVAEIRRRIARGVSA